MHVAPGRARGLTAEQCSLPVVNMQTRFARECQNAESLCRSTSWGLRLVCDNDTVTPKSGGIRGVLTAFHPRDSGNNLRKKIFISLPKLFLP